MRSVLVIVILLGVIPAATSARVPLRPTACVVLLHGLWRTELSMKWLQWELEEAGFTTANPTYPSLRYSIEELALRGVGQGLEECAAYQPEQIHFVTHSLGGILVRQYLSSAEIPKLGRVVMLGPPNQGSQVADYAHSLEFLQPLAPQALEQLGTGNRSVPLQLGPVAFELGVIAGTENLLGGMPGSSDLPGDGTVAVTETVVPGMLDFIELPVGHSMMMWSDLVRDQVLYFLRNGRFNHLPATNVP